MIAAKFILKHSLYNGLVVGALFAGCVAITDTITLIKNSKEN